MCQLTTNNHDNPPNQNETRSKIPQLSEKDAEAAISRFQEFLRFETVSATASSTGAYEECAKFLTQQLKEFQLFDKIFYLPESPDHSPVVVAKWKGQDDSLPILLLNSHYDVVPADLDGWTVPPFEGLRREGKIYGRGTQDMKCVCLQYLEGIRLLKQNNPNYQPLRSIYLTFVPDEEIGGSGMAAFLDSSVYKDTILKTHGGIAMAFDEGLASTNGVLDVFYGERLPWWIDVTASGPTGHASRFVEHTAVEQLLELTKKAMAFRTGQRDLLGMENHENCTHVRMKQKQLGDVTTLNITALQAGTQVGDRIAYNVIPSNASCVMDIRVTPHMDPNHMMSLLDQWCHECSSGESCQLSWKFSDAFPINAQHASTSTDRQVNPWYGAFCDSLAGIELEINPQVFPAGTDSRFLRALGIRALGFSPMRNTEILLHEHDEYIPESVFLEGIGIYSILLHDLGLYREDEENQNEVTSKKQKVDK